RRVSGRSELQGAVDAVTALVAHGVATVEGIHVAIARKPYASLRRMPVVGEVSEMVRSVDRGITGLVYGAIRAGVAVTGGAAGAPGGAGRARPRRTTRGNLVVATLNGFAGDHLERTGNPLATRMCVVRDGWEVPPDRASLAAAFPNASPRLAVFVHGLACTE